MTKLCTSPRARAALRRQPRPRRGVHRQPPRRQPRPGPRSRGPVRGDTSRVRSPRRRGQDVRVRWGSAHPRTDRGVGHRQSGLRPFRRRRGLPVLRTDVERRRAVRPQAADRSDHPAGLDVHLQPDRRLHRKRPRQDGRCRPHQRGLLPRGAVGPRQRLPLHVLQRLAAVRRHRRCHRDPLAAQRAHRLPRGGPRRAIGRAADPGSRV